MDNTLLRNIRGTHRSILRVRMIPSLAPTSSNIEEPHQIIQMCHLHRILHTWRRPSWQPIPVIPHISQRSKTQVTHLAWIASALAIILIDLRD